MGCLPIIQRELTVAARRRETWALRLLFAGGLGMAYIAAMFFEPGSFRNRGATALAFLAFTGFSLSLGAGAYLTADAISFERREGTLGLLFLTPLNGLQLVLGKVVTHSLQVVLAVLGAIPFLFLPVVVGGVTWGEVARVVLVLVLTLLVSLAVGIFWSTLANEAQNTAMGSLASMLLLSLLPWIWTMIEALFSGRVASWSYGRFLSPLALMIQAFEDDYQSPGGASTSGFSGTDLFWISAVIQATLAVVLVGLAGWRLMRSWRLDPGTAKPIASKKTEPATDLALAAEVPETVSAPGKRSSGSWDPTGSSRLGEQPPLIWLAQRSVEVGRGFQILQVCLGSFFVVMLVTSVTSTRWQEGFVAALLTAYATHILCRVHFAWASVRWLHDHRRSGALELLLTTPVAEADVIEAHHTALRRGHRRSLVMLFSMNALLQLMILLFRQPLHIDENALRMFSIFFVGGAIVTKMDFSTLRWLGLREALRQPTSSKAASRVFTYVYAVPFLALGAVFVLASGGLSFELALLLMGAWIGLCLAVGGLHISECRRWIGKGLRLRAAES